MRIPDWWLRLNGQPTRAHTLRLAAAEKADRDAGRCLSPCASCRYLDSLRRSGPSIVMLEAIAETRASHMRRAAMERHPAGRNLPVRERLSIERRVTR